MELLGILHRNRRRALLAAAVNTVFIGTGSPFGFFFSNIVNGRTDCSYENPVITPSDA